MLGSRLFNKVSGRASHAPRYLQLAFAPCHSMIASLQRGLILDRNARVHRRGHSWKTSHPMSIATEGELGLFAEACSGAPARTTRWHRCLAHRASACSSFKWNIHVQPSSSFLYPPAKGKERVAVLPESELESQSTLCTATAPHVFLDNIHLFDCTTHGTVHVDEQMWQASACQFVSGRVRTPLQAHQANTSGKGNGQSCRFDVRGARCMICFAVILLFLIVGLLLEELRYTNISQRVSVYQRRSESPAYSVVSP